MSSRWSKRSEEEKEKIFNEAQHQEQVANTKMMYPVTSTAQLKAKCDDAKKRAGHEGTHCSACDLRCPGCPFEFTWPEEPRGNGK